MFVAQILQELDAELKRLQIARDTIVSLLAAPPVRQKRAPSAKHKAPVALREAVPALVAEPAPDPMKETPGAVMPTPRRGRPKGSRNLPGSERRSHASRLSEPTALGRAVSAGPVFVSAAELEQRRKQPVVAPVRKPAEQMPSEGKLESLVREIAARRVEAAA